jgi:hypothetical protein
MGINKKLMMNAKELKAYLVETIESNRFLQAKGGIPQAVGVEGPSGIGKTSVILEVGKDLGLHVVKLNLATIEELGDLVGFPVRQFEMCPPVTEDITDEKSDCVWVDEHAINEYSKLGYQFTSKKRMSYCPPEWIADAQEGGILLLDDYTRADLRFLQATMELIDRQEYISWKLPKDWHIILSTNPDNGDFHVNTLDSAQKGRFFNVEMKFDVDCWAEWAERAGMDSRCINFVLMNPEMVEKAQPRVMTRFFDKISCIKDFQSSLSKIERDGESSVGLEFATAFCLFINNKLDKLPNPKNLLTHKDYEKVQEVLTSAIGKNDTYRADIAAVITRRIFNYSLYMVKEKQMTSSVIDRIVEISTDKILTNDLKYYLVNNLLNEERSTFQKIMMNPQIMKMTVK